MPLLLPYGTLTPDTLHKVLSAFPHLPVILLEVPRLGRNHSLYRLMALHDNLVLCVSALYGVHLGLEDLCRNFGDQRLVFGSGYPICEGGASITALTYANLQDDTKEAIAHRNLWRILQEVQV